MKEMSGLGSMGCEEEYKITGGILQKSITNSNQIKQFISDLNYIKKEE